jgi:nicotinate-nucleotide adenylyltransferase
VHIGVLGGTFDPPHIGHLIVAEEARERLGLEQVLLVPVGQPPHKPDREISPPEHRAAMVGQAIAGNPHLALSRVDLDRSGPCYSVDTVRLLREAMGAHTEIDFIIGADSLRDLARWRQPERLIRMCRVVVLRRPGYPIHWAQIDRQLPGASALIQTLEAPQIDISSSAIRERVRRGRSIRYWVPEVVRRYIHEQRLYTQQNDAE